MADKTVMSALMMQIFSRLYHSEDYMDNAKNIAKALHLEYRALNAGVGWAGNKIREMYESGGLLTYHASEKKDETPREEETGEFRLSETPASRVRRSPWEYVFDGSEDGTPFSQVVNVHIEWQSVLQTVDEAVSYTHLTLPTN